MSSMDLFYSYHKHPSGQQANLTHSIEYVYFVGLFQACAITSKERNDVPHMPKDVMFDPINITCDHGRHTKSALPDCLHCLQRRKASDNQNQRQNSALQAAAVTSLHVQVDSERSLQVSSMKQFMSYKFITILKWPLDTRMGICDTLLSSFLPRYPLEMTMPCPFE